MRGAGWSGRASIGRATPSFNWQTDRVPRRGAVGVRFKLRVAEFYKMGEPWVFPRWRERAAAGSLLPGTSFLFFFSFQVVFFLGGKIRGRRCLTDGSVY